jgi:Asparagine synthase
MVDDLLSPEAVRHRGLFDAPEVRRLIAANRAGHEDNALRIWALLTLELWQLAFVDAAARTNGDHATSTPAAPAIVEVGGVS